MFLRVRFVAFFVGFVPSGDEQACASEKGPMPRVVPKLI